MTQEQFEKQLYDEFKAQVEFNDAIVKEEMGKKTRLQMVEEYNKFVKDNNCKIKPAQKRKGAKND